MRQLSFAILSNNKVSGFIPILSKSLKKRLELLGQSAEIINNGLDLLSLHDNKSKNILKFIKRDRFIKSLAKYDCIVVVIPLPNSHLAHRFVNIEYLRKKLNIPIVLYQNYYFGANPIWLNESIKNNNWGLERYDWYLTTSLASEHPVTNTDNPLSWIGVDLNEDNLFHQNEQPFLALLDFNREGFEDERALQVEALKKCNVSSYLLQGKYTLAQIRKIYQKSCIYFLSFHESFGVPICELQLCGSYIFMPKKYWAQAHYLKSDLFAQGEGSLSTNFKVYNDFDHLVELINEIKANYNPEVVINTFKKKHSKFFVGDQKTLQDFIEKINSKKINHFSHKSYKEINQIIINSNKRYINSYQYPKEGNSIKSDIFLHNNQ